MFEGPFNESILRRAQDKSLVEINIHDLRKWGLDDRRTVDDRPYGGGPGMIMRVDVVDAALKSLVTNHQSYSPRCNRRKIHPTKSTSIE